MVRFKNRYLVVELLWKSHRSDETLTEAVLLGKFRESIQQVFGDYGLGSALASLQVKYFNPVTNICVIRCSRDEHRQVWAALTLVTDIRNAVVTIRLLHLTGTAAACKALTQQCDDRGLQGLKLTRPQAQAVEDAKERLSHMEV